MKYFLKGFFSLFDWMSPKTLEEQFEDLDDSMQNLYDKMGWGQYKKPSSMKCWNDTTDTNRALETNQDLVNNIYGYSFRKIVTKEFYKPWIKDPARSFKNKY